jgi:hypothetical protein
MVNVCKFSRRNRFRGVMRVGGARYWVSDALWIGGSRARPLSFSKEFVMTTSGIASGTSAAYAPNQAAFQQRKQDFKSLSDALSSGDLTAAQQAYAALQKDAPKLVNGSGQAGSQTGQQGGGSSRQNAFAALGQALQSGDLSGAQQAFSQLQQSGRHHHHHHGSGAQSSSDSSTTVSPSSGGMAGTSGTISVTA